MTTRSTANAMPPARPLSRIWDRLERIDGQCWIWPGAKLNSGYGCINVKGRTITTHRVAWELSNGQPVPNGLQVLHRCDVRLCCNPAHLFVGTQSENLLDMAAKGRYGKRRIPTGARHHNAKLSDSDVRAIRKGLMAGATKSSLALTFGVHRRAIYDIATGKGWAHVA